jgi:hypothetical protein
MRRCHRDCNHDRYQHSFLAEKKNIKFLFPANTEENIARVNLLRKPSDSSILMAVDAINAIFLDQENP